MTGSLCALPLGLARLGPPAVTSAASRRDEMLVTTDAEVRL
jgi:hypothetical protein